MIQHGGNLQHAMLQYGGTPQDWLDLSTGINPVPYPAPPIAADAWHRLPEPCTELVTAACAYYGAPAMLPVAGTQAAIQALPRIRPQGRVTVAAPSYAEHAYQWRQAGHQVTELAFDAKPETWEHAIAHSDVVVICSPNNPTGEHFAPTQLCTWAAQLAQRGGWLVVDEAFGDTLPALSVATHRQQAGLIVLRSVGKFFGLAGLRLGFVAAAAQVLHDLEEWLGPWTISGPAQAIGSAALRDKAWQAATRQRLAHEGARLRQVLAHAGIQSGGTDLFQWWPEPQAEAFHQHMAERHIWVRLFPQAARGIRLGLPADEAGWQRLAQALQAWQVARRTATSPILQAVA